MQSGKGRNCHVSLVEARKEDPSAETEWEPGGKKWNENLFILKTKAGNLSNKTWKTKPKHTVTRPNRLDKKRGTAQKK